MVIFNVIFGLFFWLIATLLVIPIGSFVHKFCPKLRFAMARVYHKTFCKIMNIKVEVKGQQEKEAPVLFVSSHSSYLDIPVLGTLIKASFVSKKEIESWPVIGFLAKLQNTVFIKRERKHAGTHSNSLVERIQEGDSLIVFPEGTSSHGNRVLPFKSSLFSIADQKVKIAGNKEKFLKVQPVSVSFVKLHEQVVSYRDRQYYSWVGDEYFFPHLIQFLKLGKKKILVEFHPAVSMDEFKNRKEMAQYCHDVVAEGVSDHISGRDC